MYEAKLASPRPKKRTRYNRIQEHEEGSLSSYVPVLQQPFPVPISSLTGIKANNSVWRWYRGKLKNRTIGASIQAKDEGNDPQMLGNSTCLYYYVEISSDNEAHSILPQMGFFGEKDELISYHSSSKSETKGFDTFVIMEDFEPKIVKEQPNYLKDDRAASQESSELSVTCEETENKPDERSEYVRLELYEAFFLSYGLGCLLVNNCDSESNDEMSIDDMWLKFCQVDNEFPQKYAVYHHFRSRGWVVKNGCKFGADFLLYKDGPPFYHASYSVLIRKFAKGDAKHNTKSSSLDWTSLAGLNRVTESAAKELLLVDVFESLSPTTEKYLETVTEYLNSVTLQEVLVRRWIPSSERDET